ncbi:MAG: S-layer homology domain-containing protein [Eubacteriales bacterium]|nr:S-layer homology domain-containing protein [Eubacteriales bacterium]
MNCKRYAAAIVSIAMLFAVVLHAGAATFPDVLPKHSWAAEYIEDMVSRGLIKGYTDGTFRPDNPISKLEAVILAARILGITKSENEEFVQAALEAYSSELEDYDINYKAEVAYLLYWNVLKLSELPSYIGDDVKNTAMRRFEVATLLTKVMGGEKEALESGIIILDYADSDTVPTGAKAYVQYITDKRIMQGMEDNKFMPMFEVTRAMIVTMMHRMEISMEPYIEKATVVSSGADSLVVRKAGENADTEIEVTDDIIINIDGYASSPRHFEKGFVIQLQYHGDQIKMIEGLSKRNQLEKSGVIKNIARNKGITTIVVTPTGSAGETETSYELDEDCEIKVDNKIVTYTSLRQGNYVVMKIKDSKVVSIIAETKESSYVGTITDIDLSGDTPQITIKKNDGSLATYTLMVDAVVIRNSVVDQIRSLSVGDRVDVAVSAGRIKRISANSIDRTFEGIIEEIVISSTSPSITFKISGQSKKYAIAPNTTFYVDDQEATIYDMRLGATATISLKSENIDKVKIASTVVPSQLIGIITSVNPVYNVITMDVIDTTTGKTSSQTVVAKSNVKIIDNTNTRVSTVKGIEPGRSVIVLGALDSYGTYAANTIIITQ